MATSAEAMTTGDLALRVQFASMKAWDGFLDTCLFKRLGPSDFESSAPKLHSKHPLPADALADLLLRPRASNKDTLDPRIPLYLESALTLGYVDAPAILKALYNYSTSHSQSQSGTDGLPEVRWRSSYSAEEVLFYRLTKAVVQGAAIGKGEDAVRMVDIVAKWMALFTGAFATLATDVMDQLEAGGPREEMETARAAFVALLISVCDNQVVLRTVERPDAKSTSPRLVSLNPRRPRRGVQLTGMLLEVRRAMLASLVNFVPTLQNSSIAERLELFRSTIASFEPADKTKDAAKGIDELLDSAVGHESVMLPELHIANSRAALYIYLSACLVGRPLIDDHALFAYLHNRYQGNMQTAAIDLILASFDVLANSVFRNDGHRVAHLLRSYLINKLPLLLVALGNSMFPPASPEYCITEALNRVDTNTFPTLSSMFDDTRNSNPVTDNVREEFCFACCLHDLMPQSHIETLLGENTYQTLPSGGRYARDDLVRDCMANPEKIHSLIGELDNMDGNVGAVCQALTEVLTRLCASKETMTLKMLCSQLARKPLSLDVMLLFAKPATILHPICDLLDNWRYEEDQNEYQPVYEEFGSVLLLLLAFTHRYELTPGDLGIRSRESFVAKLLTQGHLSRSLDELTELENGHLNGWIHGLFDTAGGLGDELMSSCPPQDFYLLIPTLFLNISLAFAAGALSEETLKGGLECEYHQSVSRLASTRTDRGRPRGHISASLSGPGHPLFMRPSLQRPGSGAKGCAEDFTAALVPERDIHRGIHHAYVGAEPCCETVGALAPGLPAPRPHQRADRAASERTERQPPALAAHSQRGAYRDGVMVLHSRGRARGVYQEHHTGVRTLELAPGHHAHAVYPPADDHGHQDSRCEVDAADHSGGGPDTVE
ncbi:hypothetical protein VUR80DRAFT_588 [Thermomyces stellatus]